MTRTVAFLLALLNPGLACAQGMPEIAAEADHDAAVRFDADRLIADVRTLAADSMEGRLAGSDGGARARAFLLARFQEVGLRSFNGGYVQEFALSGGGPETRAANVVGYLRGSEYPDRYIVLTAHYDHLGVQGRQIFNGADDNASGSAAILALAQYFRDRPHRHSIVFAALDAEEGSAHGGAGLQGARAFLARPPVPLERLVSNVNLDMISRSDRDELFAAGTFHYPALRPLVERVAARAPLRLLTGHDQPDLPAGDDWTAASDHGVFHELEIPFLYFGVEDHADYHRPTDVFEKIDRDFYVRAVATVIDYVEELDRKLDGDRPTSRSAVMLPWHERDTRTTVDSRTGSEHTVLMNSGSPIGRPPPRYGIAGGGEEALRRISSSSRAANLAVRPS